MTPQPTADDNAWAPWRELFGRWVGTGDGTPGQGTGWFTFALDLQGQILVRTNHAEYPATASQPAYVHDDLLIVYQDPAGAAGRAIYFDNEGHVIDYTTITVTEHTVQLLSAPVPALPRYRLTYTPTGPDALTLTFEIAPPGAPEAFVRYIEAQARREAGLA
ncbi:MAG TPA: hypothetical protein VKY74_07860 [Chloroflexia bacterium]|nr:hypothetical protein [Chloroflexia bacterium]